MLRGECNLKIENGVGQSEGIRDGVSGNTCCPFARELPTSRAGASKVRAIFEIASQRVQSGAYDRSQPPGLSIPSAQGRDSQFTDSRRGKDYFGKCIGSGAGADRAAHDQSQVMIRKGIFQEVKSAVAH